MTKRYDVGIYTRLSIDDKSNPGKTGKQHNGESVSIENQKAILTEFVAQQGWTVKRIYTDDGWSGGNFSRPGFQQMLEDAAKGEINLILVKDLSRLGRDSVGVGRYTDEIFPSLGCRFLAVADGIDSECEDNDILPFLTLLNDYNLRDISRKVKAVLRAKAENGQHLSGSAPYGYQKDEQDRHKIVVDEYAAGVVRQIYQMRLQGYGYSKIAAALNNQNILPPRDYWYQKQGKENPYKGRQQIWRTATVKVILNNDFYIGYMTLMKYGSLSYKNKKIVRKEPETWIRIENAHPPLVDMEVFSKVQQINQDAAQNSNKKEAKTSIFSGLLVCADCGAKMVGNVETQTRKNGHKVQYRSFQCSTYHQSGHSKCSSHRIYELSLLQIVQQEIHRQIQALPRDEQLAVNQLSNHLSKERGTNTQRLSSQIRISEKRLDDLDKLVQVFYEDHIRGLISDETLTSQCLNAQYERKQICAHLDMLHQQLKSYNSTALEAKNWLQSLRNALNLQELDRQTLTELIDKIVIGQRNVSDGVKHQDIHIIYRWANALGDSH